MGEIGGLSEWVRITLIFAAAGLFVYLAAQIYHILRYYAVPELTVSEAISRHRGTIVVTDYNTSSGFGWLLYNLLNAAHLAETQNARMVAYFCKGHYKETRPEFVQRAKARGCVAWDEDNWLANYFDRRKFEPGRWRPFLRRHFGEGQGKPVARHAHAQHSLGYPSSGVRHFDRRSLNTLAGRKRDYCSLWRKYLVPAPHIQAELDLLASHLLDGAFVYAVHYRGSDKFAHSGQRSWFGGVKGVAKEDDPEHPPYEWVLEKVHTEVLANISERGAHGEDDYCVFVASDEQPFVDAAKAHPALGRFVRCKPNTLRSSVSTSGLELDTQLCADGGGGKHPDCAKLQELVEASVHRGHRDKSAYDKGKDVLLDVLLMARAQVLFRSRGNVSNMAEYASVYGKHLQVRDLAMKALVAFACATFAFTVFIAGMVGYMLWDKDSNSSVYLRNLETPPSDPSNKLYVYDGQLYWDSKPVSGIERGAPGQLVVFGKDGTSVTGVGDSDLMMPLHVPVRMRGPGFIAD